MEVLGITPASFCWLKPATGLPRLKGRDIGRPLKPFLTSEIRHSPLEFTFFFYLRERERERERTHERGRGAEGEREKES